MFGKLYGKVCQEAFCNVCRKAFYQMFAMFVGKPFTRCLQCLSESLLPDVCNVCRKAFNHMFAMFVGKLLTICLQCLSESLSLVRPETGTGEVVAGPLGSASAFN